MAANDWKTINRKGRRRRRWWPNSATATADYKIAQEKAKENNTDTEE